MNKNTAAWIEAMRLRTLPVSVAGVIAGIGCAVYYHSFKVLPALICLIFAVVAQIASNFANEYYDYKNGLDKKGREGFRRGVTEGDISPIAMKRATYTLLFFDALLGCSLIYYGGWWLIAIGVLVALFAVGYSTGPYPLSHHGLGDLAVIIFFGFVPVTFTCYVQTGVWDWHSIAIPASFGIGMLAANVLIVNNYRDADDDREVGKHTTVVIFGRKAMSTVYLIFGIAGVGLLFWGIAPHLLKGTLIPALLAVTYLFLWRQITQKRGKALNPMLGKTAKVLLLASILFVVEVILSQVFQL